MKEKIVALVQLGSRFWLRALTGVVLLALGVSLLIAQQGRQPARTAPLEARLELAAGAVQVDQGGRAVPAISGTALSARAKVLSGKGARALVRLSEGSSVFLRDDTTLSLADKGIELSNGEVWMDTPPAEHKPGVHQAGDVTISAPDAGLSISRKGDTITVYVARGLAVVTAPGGRVELNAGEQATVTGKGTPVMKPVTFWADWTGGMADRRTLSSLAGSGTGTIYGVDMSAPRGSPARSLEVSRQSVRAVIRDGLAETEVDQTFFNPHSAQLEGWYWFTIPEGASVTGFALETNGNLVDGELIERQEAAAQYSASVATGHQPALLEWMDSRTFRARIFPVPAAGSRRVVLRYMQLIPFIDGTLRYVYPMQSREGVRIGEFSLEVDLGDEGKQMILSTLADARVVDEGRRVTMRRSGFKPLTDFQLEARLKGSVAPVRVSRFSAGGQSADYVMARYVPDLDWDRMEAQPADIVLVVDTSAAGDDAARQLKSSAAEAVLRALSAHDHFALMALDVRPIVLHPAKGLAAASESEITTALERLADHPSGGATDLASMFDTALGLLHGTEQPAIVYVGDGMATSGELSGEQLAERLTRALSTSRARMFSVAVGGDANLALLGELTRAGGGSVFALDNAEQTTERALRLAAAVKTPTITDFEMDLGAGLDETYVSAHGKVSRGDEVILLARTHHDIPDSIKIRGRVAGKPFEKQYPVDFHTSMANMFVPRLWAAEAMRSLLGTAVEPESVRGKIIAMGIEYGLMTPFTSFIALESEMAYRQRGIQRRSSPLRGIRLTALTVEQEESMLATLGGAALAATGLGCGKRDAPSVAPSATRESYAKQAPAPPPAPGAMADQAMELENTGRAEMAPRVAPSAGPRRASKEEVRFDKLKSDKGGSSGRDDARGGGGERPSLARSNMKNATSGPELGTCSDAARRPLYERTILWDRRLRGATDANQLVEVYAQARASCELPDWRAESRFLHLLQRFIQTESAVTEVLAFFASTPEAQKYLGRLIMRRAVEPSMIAAVERALIASPVDWTRIDQELAAISDPAQRLTKLREHVARVPNDPNGIIRLCRLLAATNHLEEARVHAGRLKEQGLLTPLLVRELGDILAREKLDDEALRTYSEIVEFDPRSVASRRLLGDI